MSLDAPFDRALRRLRRDRAAPLLAEADYLHRRAAEEMLERLDLVKRDFSRALLIAGAGGPLGERLRGRGMAVVEADPGFAFAAAAGGVQCDEDRLPFADGSFDLALAPATLDSVNDLPGALILIRRALKPDGLFLGAFAGAGSLGRLKRAMLAADAAQGGAAARVHPQIDVRAAGDLLARAGFALPVVDVETVEVRFRSLVQLVADLRAMGATNLLSERSRVPLGRAAIAAGLAEWEKMADADGRVTERFEILHLLGWAPAPSQPRPAPRGSGTASLAALLGRKDEGL